MPKPGSPEKRIPGTGSPKHRFIALFFFLLGILLYANTLGHRYALDDGLLILDNAYTKRGIAGIPDILTHDSFDGYFQAHKNLVSGGRYRPLSQVAFALEYQAFGPNPTPSHAINILLYGLTGPLLYLLLVRLLRVDPRVRWWMSPPFLITLIYMVHPLHTEIVANIKGSDEILAFLFALGSWHMCLSYYESPDRTGLAYLTGAWAFFMLGLFSKESTLPFLVSIPLGLWFFRRGTTSRLAVVIGTLVLAAAIYMWTRSVYAGPMTALQTKEILNDPFIGATLDQRLATVFKTLGIYLGLFLFPARLSHDYYYNQIPLTTFADPAAWLPLLLTIGLAIVAFKGVKQRDPIAFGLLFFAFSFSLVSNVFITVGTTMAERFLYIPSFGLATALVVAVTSGSTRFWKRAGARTAAIVLILASAALSARTIVRNLVWKNNFTLFTSDVKVSPRSAKVQTAAGSVLIVAADEAKDPAVKRRHLEDAVGHLHKAIQIYPRHGLAWFLLGSAWFKMGPDKMAEALRCYRQAVALDPTNTDGYKNIAVAAHELGDTQTALINIRRYRSVKPADTGAGLLEATCLEESGRADSAIVLCERLLAASPDSAAVWGRLGVLYGKSRGDYAKAIAYLRRALALDPKEAAYYANLGSALALSGQREGAVQILEAGLARFGDTYSLNWNLGLAWKQSGDDAKARGYFAKAEALRKSTR
jgi:Flp pilus assembly protein TadD